MLPLLVAPAVLALAMAPLVPLIGPLLALPALAWAALCLGWGVALGLKAGRADVALAGPAAMIMHFAWSAGFWRRLLQDFLRPDAPGSEPLLPFAR
jgi:succinoglycan biosynthesis protein ExoA